MRSYKKQVSFASKSQSQNIPYTVGEDKVLYPFFEEQTTVLEFTLLLDPLGFSKSETDEKFTNLVRKSSKSHSLLCLKKGKICQSGPNP